MDTKLQTIKSKNPDTITKNGDIYTINNAEYDKNKLYVQKNEEGEELPIFYTDGKQAYLTLKSSTNFLSMVHNKKSNANRYFDINNDGVFSDSEMTTVVKFLGSDKKGQTAMLKIVFDKSGLTRAEFLA